MPHRDFAMVGPKPALRALKSELAERDGLAWQGGVPFSGLVFDAGNTAEAVHVTFYDVTLSCQRIRGVESYSNGRPGGDFALLDIELPYMHTPMVTLDEFPYYAQDYDAKLDDGSGFSGALYVSCAKDGWEARLYTAGDQDVRLWWYPDGRLAHASSHVPVGEEFSWYKDGTWKRCCIGASPDTTLCIAFAPDHRVTLLILEGWKAAVSDPGRRMNFQCIDKFDDVLRLRSDTKINLRVDNDFIDNIPKILESKFLDDTETIDWDSAVFSASIADLFEALSKKKLKQVIFQSLHESSKVFAVALAERLPELKILSYALNMAKRGG